MRLSIKKIRQLKLIFLVGICLISTSCFIFEKSTLLEKDSKDGFKIPADTLISIKHTEYLGQGYSIVISADGKTELTPTEYMGHGKPTVTQGVPIRNRINQEQLIEIIREFEKADFFSFKDEYKMGKGDCSDQPTDGSAKTISITIKGRKKSVEWENCSVSGQVIPRQLPNITDKIQKAVNLKQIL